LEFVVRLMVFAVFLFLVQELFRRAGKWAAWGVFLVLPLTLVPYWVYLGQVGVYTGFGVFPWVKLVSLQIAASWLTALRFTALGSSRWATGLLFLMLPVNMLEAITLDAFGGHLAHYLLVLTGFLLIFTVPHPMRGIRIDTADHYCELRYVGMTRTWIAGYTLWNLTFVYLNYPVITGHHVAVLASAFVVGMADPSRWLQSRTFTLAADTLVLATIPGVVIPIADTSNWASRHREDIVAGACLAAAVVYAGRFFMRRGDQAINDIATEPSDAPQP
jgi:hypothetical protein